MLKVFFRKSISVLLIIRERGVRFMWDYFKESILFDLQNGTSTFARVPKAEQTIDSSKAVKENGLLYVASFTSVTVKTFRHAQKAFGMNRANTAQFIDLGCGKGKALLVHAKIRGDMAGPPAIGIEYDPVLANLACKNVAKVPLARDTVKIFTDSATNLRQYIETDSAIVYIYNSFQGETLDSTLDALKGLPHVMIYVDPVEKFKLSELGYTIIKENNGRYNADTWLVAKSADFIE